MKHFFCFLIENTIANFMIGWLYTVNINCTTKGNVVHESKSQAVVQTTRSTILCVIVVLVGFLSSALIRLPFYFSPETGPTGFFFIFIFIFFQVRCFYVHFPHVTPSQKRVDAIYHMLSSDKAAGKDPIQISSLQCCSPPPLATQHWWPVVCPINMCILADEYVLSVLCWPYSKAILLQLR